MAEHGGGWLKQWHVTVKALIKLCVEINFHLNLIFKL
jgi:hypothetical protein